MLTWSTCFFVIVTALVTAFSLLAIDGLWDAFYATDAQDMQGLIALAAVVLVVFAAAACFVASRGLKGRAWALVTWGVLSLATVLVSVMCWALLVSLLVAAAAVVTITLLLTPSARAWPRAASGVGVAMERCQGGAADAEMQDGRPR